MKKLALGGLIALVLALGIVAIPATPISPSTETESASAQDLVYNFAYASQCHSQPYQSWGYAYVSQGYWVYDYYWDVATWVHVRWVMFKCYLIW